MLLEMLRNEDDTPLCACSACDKHSQRTQRYQLDERRRWTGWHVTRKVSAVVCTSKVERSTVVNVDDAGGRKNRVCCLALTSISCFCVKYQPAGNAEYQLTIHTVGTSTCIYLKISTRKNPVQRREWRKSQSSRVTQCSSCVATLEIKSTNRWETAIKKSRFSKFKQSKVLCPSVHPSVCPLSRLDTILSLLVVGLTCFSSSSDHI